MEQLGSALKGAVSRKLMQPGESAVMFWLTSHYGKMSYQFSQCTPRRKPYFSFYPRYVQKELSLPIPGVHDTLDLEADRDDQVHQEHTPGESRTLCAPFRARLERERVDTC